MEQPGSSLGSYPRGRPFESDSGNQLDSRFGGTIKRDDLLAASQCLDDEVGLLCEVQSAQC